MADSINPEDLQERTDLPMGHWLYGQKAATEVVSGQPDLVVVDGEVKPVTSPEDLEPSLPSD